MIITLYTNTVGCPRFVDDNYLIYKHNGMSKVKKITLKIIR